MFLLFFNLYMAMFSGTWNDFTYWQVLTICKPNLNVLGTFLTSIFGDNQMATLGDIMGNSSYIEDGFISIVSLVLALITSIGIVVVATKGIKRLFTVFFYGVR